MQDFNNIHIHSHFASARAENNVMELFELIRKVSQATPRCTNEGRWVRYVKSCHIVKQMLFKIPCECFDAGTVQLCLFFPLNSAMVLIGILIGIVCLCMNSHVAYY